MKTDCRKEIPSQNRPAVQQAWGQIPQYHVAVLGSRLYWRNIQIRKSHEKRRYRSPNPISPQREMLGPGSYAEYIKGVFSKEPLASLTSHRARKSSFVKGKNQSLGPPGIGPAVYTYCLGGLERGESKAPLERGLGVQLPQPEVGSTSQLVHYPGNPECVLPRSLVFNSFCPTTEECWEIQEKKIWCRNPSEFHVCETTFIVT